LDKVAAGEVPDEAINDTLESIEGEFEDKADNIACFLKSLIYEAKAIKEEIDTLSERMKAKQAKADKLQDYLYGCMKTFGKTKLETARNVLQIKINPPSVEVGNGFVEWAKQFRDDLLSYKDPTPDKKLIKAAMATDTIPHCSVVQKERLEVK
jgi:hypothetical protein